jgi:hypothetical protein
MVPDASASIAPEVSIARPLKAKFPFIEYTESDMDLVVSATGREQILTALIWRMGCHRTQAPSSLRVDCSGEEYEDRIADKWPEYTCYWQDAFADYSATKIFTTANIDLGSEAG